MLCMSKECLQFQLNPVYNMLTSIWSKISRFLNELLETRQDKDFRNNDIEKGNTKNTSIIKILLTKREMHEIKKIENILLYSVIQLLYINTAHPIPITCCHFCTLIVRYHGYPVWEGWGGGTPGHQHPAKHPFTFIYYDQVQK